MDSVEFAKNRLDALIQYFSQQPDSVHFVSNLVTIKATLVDLEKQLEERDARRAPEPRGNRVRSPLLSDEVLDRAKRDSEERLVTIGRKLMDDYKRNVE